MKKLLLILLLASCQKESEQECYRCDNVVYDNYATGQSVEYITEIKEYCDSRWKELDGKRQVLTTHSYSTWKCSKK